MPRTPSPRRRRSRSRDRERKRRRSRSPRDRRDERRECKRLGEGGHRHRGKSWSRSRSRSPDKKRKDVPSQPPKNITAADLEGKSMDEQEMLKMMGFCGFSTTKNKKVEGNDVGEVHVILKRKYRQYMNRKGGFNRPLDFVA